MSLWCFSVQQLRGKYLVSPVLDACACPGPTERVLGWTAAVRCGGGAAFAPYCQENLPTLPHCRHNSAPDQHLLVYLHHHHHRELHATSQCHNSSTTHRRCHGNLSTSSRDARDHVVADVGAMLPQFLPR